MPDGFSITLLSFDVYVEKWSPSRSMHIVFILSPTSKVHTFVIGLFLVYLGLVFMLYCIVVTPLKIMY